MKESGKTKRLILLIFSIMLTLVIGYHVIIYAVAPEDYLDYKTIFLKIILSAPDVNLESTEIFLPRGTFTKDFEEDNDKIVATFRIGDDFIGFIKWKDIATDTMIKIFEFDVREYLCGDILPKAYVYSSDSIDVYILYRMGWDSKSKDEFPIYSKIVIPEEKLLIFYGTSEHSVEDALNIVRQFVYNDSSIEFTLNKEKSAEYKLWLD